MRKQGQAIKTAFVADGLVGEHSNGKNSLAIHFPDVLASASADETMPIGGLRLSHVRIAPPKYVAREAAFNAYSALVM
jgi:hypothetical protein